MTTPTSWPPGHVIGLLLRVDEEDTLVGTAMRSCDVPALLRAAAASWERRPGPPNPAAGPDDELSFADELGDD